MPSDARAGIALPRPVPGRVIIYPRDARCACSRAVAGQARRTHRPFLLAPQPYWRGSRQRRNNGIATTRRSAPPRQSGLHDHLTFTEELRNMMKALSITGVVFIVHRWIGRSAPIKMAALGMSAGHSSSDIAFKFHYALPAPGGCGRCIPNRCFRVRSVERCRRNCREAAPLAALRRLPDRYGAVTAAACCSLRPRTAHMIADHLPMPTPAR